MKAFSITAPEDIAKEYGGDKRKIQQAAAQGLIDPTSAVLAGMFIDRIRGAAQAEQANQPTVAEQVMAPQPQPQQQIPSAGLAASPQTAQMQQPMAPRMGQPAMGRMPQPAPAQMPPAQQPPMQQPMGMAMGGGLDSIDFVEQSYAPGGVVGFAVGNPVTQNVSSSDILAMTPQQLQAVASNGNIIPSIRRQAATRLGQITPKPGQKPTLAGLTAEDLPRVPDISGAMDAVGQAVVGRENVDFGDTGVSDAGIPAGEFRGVSTGMTPGEKISALGEGLQTGFNALTGAFDSGDMDEFNRVKNAGEPVSRVEQERRDRVARMQEAQATPDFGTGRGGDPFALGEEGRALYADRARSRIDPTGTIRPLGTRDKGLGQITSDEALAMLGETKPPVAPTGRVITDPAEIAALEANTQGPGTIADQIAEQQTTTATTEPAPAPEGDKESKPADMDMPISEQFNVFQKELSGLMPKSEYGEYRKKFETMIDDFDKTKKEAKKDGFNMALLQAGLGMLAQGGGQTALQALGKAALPATKQYAKEMKDLKKEERELFKLGLSLEQMDAKERAEANRTMVNLFGRKMAGEYQIKAANIAASKKGVDAQLLDELGPEGYLAAKERIARAGATTTQGAGMTRAYQSAVQAQQKFVADAAKELEDDALVQFKAQQANMTPDQYRQQRLAEIQRLYPAPNPADFGLGGGQTQIQGVPLPANPTAATLQAGTVYQTSRGPARWNGTQFEAVQ